MLTSTAAVVLALLATAVPSAAMTIELKKRDLGITNSDGSVNLEGLETEATRLLKCVLLHPLSLCETCADFCRLSEGSTSEYVSLTLDGPSAPSLISVCVEPADTQELALPRFRRRPDRPVVEEEEGNPQPGHAGHCRCAPVSSLAHTTDR